MLKRHFPHMASEIELRIIFPAGKANTKRCRYDTLEKAGQQRQFRLDEPNAIFKRYLAFEDEDAGYIQRHAFPLQMQENGVAPREAVTLLIVRHHSSPCSVARSLDREHGSQFTKEKRCVSFISLSTL